MAVRKHSFPVGSRIRQYEILEYIGGGGMGEVYRAQHLLGKYERAIKVINTRLTRERNFVERFIREARVMARIDHQNVVRMHEFDTLDETILYMVLELLRGETLYQRMLTTKRIPLPDAVRFIREAADGLEVAHNAGIIHRDISPDNLMLVKDSSRKEMIKLIDFGVAKPIDPASIGLTTSWRSAFFIGKPEYSSPEQCGEIKGGDLLDARSDIYSLTVTFYHMISGKLPFAFHSREKFLTKHAYPSTPLSNHFKPGEIPEALDAFMLKGLAPERDARFQTMREFSTELDGIFKTAVKPGKTRFSKSMMQSGKLFAGRYELQEYLGESETGQVFKAFDREEDLFVAIKFLPSGTSDASALRRLRKKVKTSRQIMHPNLCRIYYFGKGGDTYYLTRQYIEGQTLAALIKKQERLSIEETLSISFQILQGLAALHEADTVHLDLRPQKVMIDQDWKAYIMDFGFSAYSTHITGGIGSVFYVAPEQIEAPAARKPHKRSDVYSFGITLFEMLTGKRPFTGSPIEVLDAHKHAMPPRPSQLIPDFPLELEKIIMKSLEKNPDDRYQSVQQLLDAMRKMVVKPKARFPTLHKSIAFPLELKFRSALNKKLPGWLNGAGIIQNVSFSKYNFNLAQRPEGGECISMHSSRAEAKEFGCLMQRIPAKELAGKMVRFECDIATQDVETRAGLWLQADSADEILMSQNTEQTPIQGTTAWNKYSIESFLPQSTEWLNFGIIMTGKGLLWADHFNLSTVDGVKDQPARERKIVLVLKEQELEDQTFVIPADGKNEWSIGRATQSDILLTTTNASRKHSKLTRDESGKWMIYDLGSRNGTAVNGLKVRSSALSVGDEILIGTSRLVVSEIIS